MILAVVNNVDLTPFINKDKYKINSEAMFESWQNANYVEQRIYTRSKVSGNFEVGLFGYQNMDFANFITNWNAAVTDHVVNIGVYVANENAFRAIEAYYDFVSVEHKQLNDGTVFDKITINIEEC